MKNQIPIVVALFVSLTHYLRPLLLSKNFHHYSTCADPVIIHSNFVVPSLPDLFPHYQSTSSGGRPRGLFPSRFQFNTMLGALRGGLCSKFADVQDRLQQSNWFCIYLHAFVCIVLVTRVDWRFLAQDVKLIGSPCIFYTVKCR